MIRHVFLNGLSVGSGGGLTVARELLVHLAEARSACRFTLALVEGQPLHEEMRGQALPANVALHWTPPSNAAWRKRLRYERTMLAHWMRTQGVDADVQLNGMLIPGLGIPVLAHFQDPWPYRPEAWTHPIRDALIAKLKRIGHAKSLARADAVGWTSAYLRQLVCDRQNIHPPRGEVYYNGVAESWLHRLETASFDWADRPLEILTVSNVDQYKRQDLVIRALPQVIKTPGLEKTIYRVLGKCLPEERQRLEALARSLGVENHVIIEGRVSDERVDQAFRRARCFVLMSLCESFGIPLVEAMTYGVPAVASDCCALPEVAGQAAVLSTPDDIQKLVANLVRMLTDEALARRLFEAALPNVRRFRWQQTAESMARTLERITRRPDREPAPSSQRLPAPTA